ncbi:hypothetical protein BMS3Abin10_01108 [bacterium BMS3Abin10]|nr:hypothetical protein BMS3Abin10_01108 [bacterium BMS3Abin10]GBE38144.1 hypothetical protein BMS3Bbin08_00746 [bacterium BMS3Bbin08]
MSKVVWSEAIVPGDKVAVNEYTSEYYGDKVYVEKTRALPIVE